jgi:hypothetical protein
MDNSNPRGMRDRVSPPDGVELVEKAADMEFGGMRGEAEPTGDDFVRGALGQQSGYFKFARRQLRVGVGVPLSRRGGDDDVRRFAIDGDTQAGDLLQQTPDRRDPPPSAAPINIRPACASAAPA